MLRFVSNCARCTPSPFRHRTVQSNHELFASDFLLFQRRIPHQIEHIHSSDRRLRELKIRCWSAVKLSYGLSLEKGSKINSFSWRENARSAMIGLIIRLV